MTIIEGNKEKIDQIEQNIADNSKAFEAICKLDRKDWVKTVAPKYEEKYIGGTLEDWTFHPVEEIVSGKLYGDDRFLEGDIVYTSYVVSLDEESSTLETRNTIYQLGRKLC